MSRRAVVVALAVLALSVAGSPALAAAVPTPAPAVGLGGQRAVDALGADLDAAGSVNRMTGDELRHLLTTDSTARVGPRDHVYFVDDALPAPARTAAPAVPRGPYPYDQTFDLHSDPGATRSIYLDFTSTVVAGTAWNDGYGVSTDAQPAFDNDGDPSTFSAGEQDIVQSVWQRVAEDYAPFDIDVTTRDPGPDALARSGPDDTSYGTYVKIGATDATWARTCSSSCGGVAFISAYGSAYYQPAWVFTQGVGSTNPKYIAEAASHEAGHNVGLGHDGTSSATYYSGAGAWAPIMGAGYYLPVTTFSNGDYADANNQQDDLSVIDNNGAPLRADDFPDSAVGAPALDEGVDATTPGRIGSRTDKDYVQFTRTCTSTDFAARVAPAPVSPDLRVQTRLLDGDGNVVAVSANTGQPTTELSSDTASNLAADISVGSLPPGTYFLELDGTGSGNPSADGFSDYGSLGTYTITTSSCRSTVPSAVQQLRLSALSASAGTATIAWDPPVNAGTSGVTGYRVGRSAAPGQAAYSKLLTGSPSTFTFAKLQRGTTYTLSVAAVNAAGDGPTSTVLVTLGTTPGPPTVTSVRGDGATGSATVTWTPPADSGGSPITGYLVSRDGTSTTGGGGYTSHLQPASSRSFTMQKLVPGATYTLTVQAVNAIGAGLGAARSVRLTAAPGRPTQVTGYGGRTSATTTWEPPATDGGSPITGYRVSRDGTTTTGDGPYTVDKPADARTQTMQKLRPGDVYTLSVRAINAVGIGPAVKVQVTVPTVPGQVVIGRATPGTAGGAITATASWQPDGDGGAPITGFVVHAFRVVNGADVEQIVSQRLTPDTTSYAFTLTRKGQWHFSVVAVNSIGSSPRSAFSNVVAGA